jgi:hypothetical protein
MLQHQNRSTLSNEVYREKELLEEGSKKKREKGDIGKV